MNHKRRSAAALIVLASVYLLLFVLPNLTGAKDPHMLAAFREELPEYGTDELAQFLVLSRITSVGSTPSA